MDGNGGNLIRTLRQRVGYDASQAGRSSRLAGALPVECLGECEDADDPDQAAHSLGLSVELLEVLTGTPSRAQPLGLLRGSGRSLPTPISVG